MKHALVTIVAPIRNNDVEAARGLISAMGNPGSADIRALLDDLDPDSARPDQPDEAGVHFISLHVIDAQDLHDRHASILLEFSADGTEDEAISRVCRRLAHRLKPVFDLAVDRPGNDLVKYFKAHRLRIGVGWTGVTGLAFDGTPGMSVGRINREFALAKFVTAIADNHQPDMPALERLNDIRTKVAENGEYAWSLGTPDTLPRGPGSTVAGLIVPLAFQFVATFLWPLLIGLFAVLAFGALHAFFWLDGVLRTPSAALIWLVAEGAWNALLWVLGAVAAFTVPGLIFVLLVYLDLIRREKRDWVSERRPDRATVTEILRRENFYAHNHMISVTTRKPGITRFLTSRFAFWVVGALAQRFFRPGYLGEIGTIHFARWVTLPGTRQVVFLSNYDGSWESYLEDFITRASQGLTGIWSNTVGFPKAENLFWKGATDGERFKQFARASMLPTGFWYSAYPELSVSNIRTNAAIRAGLAASLTDEEATTWLSLFSSAVRPASKLETSQIQSLIFGGLGFMPFGTLLRIDFGATGAKAWLKDMKPELAFGDGRHLKTPTAVTLALGADALAKLGLPQEAVASFPQAFVDGMANTDRARIIGDQPDDWEWSRARTHDVVLLVYGRKPQDVRRAVRRIDALTRRHGHIPSAPIDLDDTKRTLQERIEPFGFVDGISQPVIRGTYRAGRTPDPIHLVEPGEFILGYPDNRGNIPPGPALAARHDPQNFLPIACEAFDGFGSNIVSNPREIGRNGSFLVIRQLEQDRAAFWKYCGDQATRLSPPNGPARLGEPYDITPEFIAAKLIGRWKDGSSLVRNPYSPATKNSLQHVTARAGLAKAGQSQFGRQLKPVGGARSVPATSVTEDNDFLLGVEDPEGMRCPFSAHIRRANPRDSETPGSQDQIDISNRHRILRVGRSYTHALKGPKGRSVRGLMFMCLNSDIERQFEFVQQTWLNSPTFHGLSSERDPLTSHKGGSPGGLTMPTRDGPVRLASMQNFVTARGGGYFFLPGKKLVEFLSS